MFESCNTSKETRDKLIEIVSSVKLITVQRSIAKEFYNVDAIVAFIYNTIIAGGNGTLHGPGGFGKSEITKAFFKYFGIIPLVVVGHSGTDIESLLGIPNIKKLTEESKYEIAFENSVFSKPGVLILEEFLDVKPSVASALKDIITEGGYRRGDEFIPSKVGTMFICSNKAPDEVVIDYSTAAFYKERFPYSKYVIWNDYDAGSYLGLFKLVYKDIYEEEEESLKLIAELCSESCSSDTIISPRLAFNTVSLFLINHDIRDLDMVVDINLSKINEIQTRLTLERQYNHLNSKFIDLIDFVNKLEFSDLKEIVAFMYFADNFLADTLKYYMEGDELLKTITILIDCIKIKKDQAEERLIQLGASYGAYIFKIDKSYEDIRKYIFR